jgi:hypothetical protein
MLKYQKYTTITTRKQHHISNKKFAITIYNNLKSGNHVHKLFTNPKGKLNYTRLCTRTTPQSRLHCAYTKHVGIYIYSNHLAFINSARAHISLCAQHMCTHTLVLKVHTCIQTHGRAHSAVANSAWRC